MRPSGSPAIATRETTQPAPHAPPPGLLRGRLLVAIALGLPAGVFLAVWSGWHAWAIGPIDSLFGPAVAGIALLTALNAWLKRRGSRWAFSAAEVIVFYVVIATGVGMFANILEWGGLAPMLAYPIGQANPSNRWAETIWPYLPSWLTVPDAEILRGYFLGDTSPYHRDVLSAWLSPALWWTLWVGGLMWVTLCLGVIVRRRWSEEEKLPFPITEVPMRLAEPTGSIFRSPLWWVGLTAAIVIGVLRTLSEMFPALPALPFGADLRPLLGNNPPWDALRGSELWWGPWAIALPYLMPTDMILSLIVFNLLWRFEYVASRLGGWATGAYSGFPYGDEQTLGAFLALLGIILWLDRRYLAQVLRKAIGLRSALDDRGDAFSYRTAVFGALGGFAFLCWFLTHAGLQLSVAALLLLSYFLLVLAVCRVRAQVGPPSMDLQATPEMLLTTVAGTQFIGAHSLGVMALLRPFLLTQGTNPAPVQLEALRMAERAHFSPRRLAWILVAVVPLAMLCYFWANLHFGYAMGMMTARTCTGIPSFGLWAMERLQAGLTSPSGPNQSGLEAMGVGAAVTVVLMIASSASPASPSTPSASPSPSPGASTPCSPASSSPGP